MSDAFGIMVGCAGFVVGVGFGLFLGVTNTRAAQKGKPVSQKRYRKLWVIDPLLDRGPSLERHHPTLYPYPDERSHHHQ